MAYPLFALSVARILWHDTFKRCLMYQGSDRVVNRVLLIVVAGLVIVGCAQSGQRQEALSAKIKTVYEVETEAWAAYERGEPARAFDLWRKLVREAEAEASDHIDFYSNMRYLDVARYQGSMGWAHLTAGDYENARQAYNAGFHALSAGEEGHRQAMVIDNQGRQQQLQMLMMTSNYLATQGASPGIQAMGGMMNTYMQQQGNLSNAAAAQNTPILFKGLDQLSSDGIRINVLPAGPPLTNIGRLHMKGGGYCTASLIGWRIAVTNAHCVSRGGDDTPFWPLRSADELTLAFESVETPDAVQVIDFITSDKNTQRGGWQLYDYANDWALLVLDRHPVRRGHFGVVDRSDALKVGSRVFLAGYSGDQSDGRFISMHWGCTVYRLAPQIAEDNCRSWAGSSGTPMLFTDGDYRRFYVYGLHAYGRGERRNEDGTKRTHERGGGPRTSEFIDAYEGLRARLDVQQTTAVKQ